MQEEKEQDKLDNKEEKVEKASPVGLQPKEEKVEPEPTPEPAPELVSVETAPVFPTGPRVTVERRGDDVTITQVMEPSQHPLEGHLQGSKEKNQKNLWQTFLSKIQFKKARNKEKIIKFIEQKGKIQNNDVERLLHVSDATATRYLDELEKEGKIRQFGVIGKYVYYEKA